MELPGGLMRDGRLRRDYRFRTVTGELERNLAESGLYTETLPQQVSRILTSSLQEVAGHPADINLVRSLSPGDRQFLLLQLEAKIDASPHWFTVRCSGCGEQIQFQLQPDHLPMKPAGVGYPEMSVKLSIGEATLRVPNGADEEFVSLLDSNSATPQIMLSRLLKAQGKPVEVSMLRESDLEDLDHALDEMSPQAVLKASIECPHCGLVQQAEIDPYVWLIHETDALDQEIHALAFNYHWSEKEILMLPRTRRRRYLQMIERSLGKYQADDHIRGMQGSV